MTERKTQVVDQVPFGVYIAKTTDGRYIANQDGDLLNIVSKKDDPKRLNQLKEAARSYGFESISVEWRAGARQISDEEFEEQMERHKEGKVADPYDLGVLIDEYRNGGNHD